MEKRRVFVDMDGTLAMFRRIKQLEDLYERGFFLSMHPHMGVIEMIHSLMQDERFEVYILSACQSDSVFAQSEKEEWLNRYLPAMLDKEHIIFSVCGQNKNDFVPGGIRKGDILLDDYTQNLIAWEEAGGTGVKLMNGINGSKGTWQNAKIFMWKSISGTYVKKADIDVCYMVPYYDLLQQFYQVLDI